MLEKLANDQIAINYTDHYLHEFSSPELYEILEKKDEWSALDFEIAKTILKSRGEAIDSNMLSVLKENRLAELAKPEKSSTLQIVAGYIFAAIGGLIGLFIGGYLWSAKKVLPNGTKIYTYESSHRNHGMVITILSIAGIIFWNIYFFLSK